MRLRDGSCLSSPEAIHARAVEFLSDFLKARPMRATPDLSLFVQNVITEEENNILLQFHSIQEVKEAIFSIPEDSSLGLDGFGSRFNCSCWDIVEANVVAAVQEFFSGAPLPRLCSASYIVLLPKVPSPTRFDKFRPINLCSVVYKVMSTFGFGPRFCELIQQCISTPWFSVVVNGTMKGFFPSGRGLRQGDPLSPYLFILVEELLSRLLKHNFGNGWIISFSHPRGAPLISHLLYVDDIVVFANGGKSSLCAIRVAFAQYEDWFSQVVSKEKSSIFFPKHFTSAKKRSALRITSFSEGSFPVKYGAPLVSGRLKVIHFDGLMHWIRSQLEGWQMKFLSCGAPILLLSHIVVSLFMKFAWKLLTQNSIWVNFFKAKYVKYRQISLIEASKGYLFWKQIVAVLPKVLSNAVWKVRDGRVSFWRDNWLSSGAIIDSCEISDLPLLTIRECRIYNGWDVDLLRRLVGESKLEAILTSFGDHKDGVDILIWKPSLDGIFSLKLAWECIRVRAPKIEWARWIWHSGIPKKYSVMMGKALNFSLGVDARIKELGIPVVSKCECCVQGCLENQDHVLATGSFVAEIWRRASLSLGMPYDPPRP
ncbi:hypothetical protein F2P56_035636 [Juglans regia]|nr:hypothetical protein F2P56_035636 [Juglans regia]